MPPLVDMTGQRFGRLTVLHRDDARREKNAHWICRCDCGAIRSVQRGALRDGLTKSCGCHRAATRSTHGQTRHQVYAPEYRSWRSMRQRCMNPNAASYRYYGGRGITICERWLWSYENFLADMGPRPSPKHTLDRIENDGNYEPGNCRWATAEEQSANRRVTSAVTAFGETAPLTSWARAAGININTLRNRLEDGWRAEDALTTEVGAARKRMISAFGACAPIEDWARAAGITYGGLRYRIDSLGWSPERALTTDLRGGSR